MCNLWWLLQTDLPPLLSFKVLNIYWHFLLIRTMSSCNHVFFWKSLQVYFHVCRLFLSRPGPRWFGQRNFRITSTSGEIVSVDTVFGCLHHDTETFNNHETRIIGLGGGILSSLFFSNSFHLWPQKFLPHCFSPFGTNPSIPSKMSFGMVVKFWVMMWFQHLNIQARHAFIFCHTKRN